MTPERQKWWDSLPKREKMLREQIWEVKGKISKYKFGFQIDCFKDKAKKRLIPKIKEQKVVLTALKRELYRTTVAVYAGYYQEIFSVCHCKKCGGTFEDFGQTHCCWCGRKIVRGKK